MRSSRFGKRGISLRPSRFEKSGISVWSPRFEKRGISLRFPHLEASSSSVHSHVTLYLEWSDTIKLSNLLQKREDSACGLLVLRRPD